jgi:hypothetical protein
MMMSPVPRSICRAIEFRPDLLVGSTLSDAGFQAPHFVCSIAIWSQDAIDDIESGAKGALSDGYRYRPGMKPGVSPDGERMTEKWSVSSLTMSCLSTQA